jgi:hypothetical protein
MLVSMDCEDAAGLRSDTSACRRRRRIGCSRHGVIGRGELCLLALGEVRIVTDDFVRVHHETLAAQQLGRPGIDADGPLAIER